MDNSFEKQIRNKVGQTEVSPSADLFDAILEKRAARSKTYLGMGYKKLLMLTTFIAVITAGVFYYFLQFGDSKTIMNPGSAQLVQSEATEADGESASAMQSGNSEGSSESATSEANSGNSLKNEQTKQNSKVETASNRLIKSDRSNKNQSPNQTKGLKKIKEGFNGKPSWANADPSSYFDVDAVNRPVIDIEKHQGNSHLFVYESVNPEELDNAILRYTNASHISKIQYPMVFEAFSPVATSKTQYNLNKNHRKPLFIDFLYAQVYSTAKTGDAAVNELKNGTMNQQFGIRVSAPIKGPLSLFAGLGYMDQILHYRGNLSYDEAYTRINTKVTFINDPIKGVIRVETKDTVSGIASQTKSVDFRNQYSLLRMPLGLGYNFGAGKFDFSLYGSADLNLLTYAKVNTMLNEANALVKTSNSKSLNIGAGMSFMAAYRISPRFKLIAEPGLHYMRLNGRNTGNFTNEKILNFTASLGIRYSVF